MEPLTTANLLAFTKRFRCKGGLLLRFRIRNNSREACLATLVLSVQDNTTKKTVRLRLRFRGVEEYRFQRRPGQKMVRLTEVKFGFFEGLLYLNLDAFAEADALIDFRASDWYLGAKSAEWELLAKSPK